MSRLEIHIDALVLEGFSSAEAHRVAAAVERELARLLAEREIPSGWTRPAEIPRLDAGSVQVHRSGGAERTGVRIARALEQSFRR
jgi:hypothetical protein